MREINFRAWDGKKNHYWDSTDHEAVDEITGTPYKKLFYLPMSWLVGDSNDWVWMQYTGLKDKNGKEIYEGDIVHKDEKTGEFWTVEYDESLARFTVFNQLNSIRDFSIDIEHQYGDCPIVEVTKDKKWSPEIIGNIYENPELLTNTK